MTTLWEQLTEALKGGTDSSADTTTQQEKTPDTMTLHTGSRSNSIVTRTTGINIPWTPPYETPGDVARNFETTGQRFFGRRFEKEVGQETIIKAYSAASPTILFVADYVVNDKFIGCLVVWAKYFNSTHYEIFKSNLFSDNRDFQRIIFLDSKNLRQETLNYYPYIRDYLGITNFSVDDIYIILDTAVKKDRIYQYKIKATQLPTSKYDLDYDAILESRQKTNSHGVSKKDTIFSWAYFMGDTKYSWVVSIMNDKVPFFDVDLLTSDLNLQAYSPDIILPKNSEDLIVMIKESISLFGCKDTFDNILKLLSGTYDCIESEFLESVDDTTNSFSYVKFIDLIKKKQVKATEDTFYTTNLLSYITKTSDSLTTLDGISQVLDLAMKIYVHYVASDSMAIVEKSIADAAAIAPPPPPELQQTPAATENSSVATPLAEIEVDLSQDVATPAKSLSDLLADAEPEQSVASETAPQDNSAQAAQSSSPAATSEVAQAQQPKPIFSFVNIGLSRFRP